MPRNEGGEDTGDSPSVCGFLETKEKLRLKQTWVSGRVTPAPVLSLASNFSEVHLERTAAVMSHRLHDNKRVGVNASPDREERPR